MRRSLLLIAALLAYGSLYPWQFEFTSAAGNPLTVLLHGWPSEWNRFILRDVVLNILIYTPLGLAGAFVFGRKHSRRFAGLAAVGFGFLFSVSMELLQVYVPGRDPSLADVLSDTIGSAAGAVFALRFDADLRRLGERQMSPFRSSAILLLLVWATAQLYPFLPALSTTHLRQELALLLHDGQFSIVEIWADCAEWFAVGLALDLVFARMRTWWLAVATMLCVPGQLLIVDRGLSLPEIVGPLAALGVWHFVRRESRARWCAWMLGSALLLRQFQPFYFLEVPQPFDWVPFEATLMDGRGHAVVVIARKAFDYGAEIWALRCAGIGYLWGGLAVTALLGATEAIQTYLPGRTPEVSDPLLALLLVLVLSGMGRLAAKKA